ncbi:MAG: cytochrome c biogenesis protein CcsA, partial [Cyclobacteriaceae bacterium]|nr:cytochrome c biogenesis protein CcsA [Cyclobacteriaceae bacterium HetDA_MAG_MS6]
MKTSWWKWGAMLLVIYAVVGGLLFEAPQLPILNETVRNLHFHVPMWFGMIFLFGFSAFHAIKYLSSSDLKHDTYSSALVETGIVFGFLGLLTGMLWANYTWGEPWSNDAKQNTSAMAMLVYLALIILRGSLKDDRERARLSAVYNVFAFPIIIVLLFILPRMADSLHPGNGGNPGFNAYDLDSNLRLVFYPAVIGWTLMGFWIASIKIRLGIIQTRL